MDQKEASARSYNEKNSHKIYMKKKLDEYIVKKRCDTIDTRTLLKKFSNDKPKRSYSGGKAPKNRIKIGNSQKIGCAYCLSSLNNKLQKRISQKIDFQEALKSVKK